MQEVNSLLSKQEKKMLQALASGKLYKEIASPHSISINTVKKHLKNVYRKLNVSKKNCAIEKYFLGINKDVSILEDIQKTNSIKMTG